MAIHSLEPIMPVDAGDRREATGDKPEIDKWIAYMKLMQIMKSISDGDSFLQVEIAQSHPSRYLGVPVGDSPTLRC